MKKHNKNFNKDMLEQMQNIAILTNLLEARLDVDKNAKMLEELAKIYSAEYAGIYTKNFESGKICEEYVYPRNQKLPDKGGELLFNLNSINNLSLGYILLKGKDMGNTKKEGKEVKIGDNEDSMDDVDKNVKSLTALICNKIADSLDFRLAHNESIVDDLTKLFNQRYFKSIVGRRVKENKNRETPSSLVMLDIDNFKLINDKYGHPAGDAVLSGIGKLLNESFYAHDTKFRYGGEEFAIYLLNCKKKDALEPVEGLLGKIRSHNEFVYKDPLTKAVIQFNVTMSAGISDTKTSDYSFKNLVKQADTALYASKENGKDRATVYNPK